MQLSKNFTITGFLPRLLALFIFVIFNNQVFAQTSVFVPAISKASLESDSQDQNYRLKLRSLPSHLDKLVAKTKNTAPNTSPFIIGGSNASRGEFPEFAQIFIDGQDGFLYAICGGTLITSNKVMTAAHCSLQPTSLYYAIPNFYSFNDSLAGKFINVSAKKVHPSYNSSTFDYDIAVLTLSSSVNSPKAKLYAGTTSLTGKTSTVIGTGLLNSSTQTTPTVLRKVNTPVTSNSICNSVFGAGTITNRMICAGFTNNGLGACNGDSGGPLWTTINGTRIQIGIVSFGPTVCELPGVYTAYSRVSALASFIRQRAPNARLVSDVVSTSETNTIHIIELLLLE